MDIAKAFVYLVLTALAVAIVGIYMYNTRPPEPVVVTAATPVALESESVATQTPSQGQRNTVGTDVMVQDVRWRLLSAQIMGQELRSSDEFIEPRRTSGMFVRVLFEIENRGSDQKTYAGVPLRDSNGREFGRYSDAVWFIPDDGQCILENLNPNVTRICTEIYEVADDATSLVFVATELNLFQNFEALISLGF